MMLISLLPFPTIVLRLSTYGAKGKLQAIYYWRECNSTFETIIKYVITNLLLVISAYINIYYSEKTLQNNNIDFN